MEVFRGLLPVEFFCLLSTRRIARQKESNLVAAVPSSSPVGQANWCLDNFGAMGRPDGQFVMSGCMAQWKRKALMQDGGATAAQLNFDPDAGTDPKDMTGFDVSIQHTAVEDMLAMPEVCAGQMMSTTRPPSFPPSSFQASCSPRSLSLCARIWICHGLIEPIPARTVFKDRLQRKSSNPPN